jgi:hypothetical protein
LLGRVSLFPSRHTRLDCLRDARAILHVESDHQTVAEAAKLLFHLGLAHGRDDVPAAFCKQPGGGLSEAG